MQIIFYTSLNMSQSNSRRIALNSLSLYVNMVVTMLATLLATRYVLKALGDEGYGIYMLVASMVALFSFLNIAMAASIQRYLSHAMGAGNEGRVREVFYMSAMLHLGIAVVLSVVLLPVGWYAVGHILDIAPHYHDSARWALLCMTGGLCVVVNSVTYEAAMNAHEHISVIALINILEALLKLFAALVVYWVAEWGIVHYAFLFFLAQLAAFLAKLVFCWVRYSEAHFRFHRFHDYGLLRELLGYAGWSLIGTTCGILRYQGAAVLLNLFFGALVNAAYGVAQQINGFLLFFAGSIVRPLRPIVIKTEGAGRRQEMLQLSFTVSRVTFIMMCLAVVPLYVNMPYVLQVWLDDVPEGALVFSRLFLLIVLINQATVGLQVALESVGRIRRLQTIVGSMHIVAIPVGYVLFKMGYSAYSIMYCIIVEELVCIVLRTWVAHKDAGIRQRDLYVRTLLPECFVFLLAFAPTYLLAQQLSADFAQLLWTTLLSTALVVVAMFTFGLSVDEKRKVMRMLQGLKFIRR